MQLVCNLRLGLALAGAAAGLINDDLEDAGKRDPIQPSNPRCYCSGVVNGTCQRGSLAVGQLQRQPVHGRTHGRQIAEFATPLLRWDATNPGNNLEDEVADSGCWSNAGWSSADQTAEPILNLLVPIRNQLLLRRKIVIERLLGDLRLARHVTDGNPLIAALGEETSGGVGDELAGARLFALAQSDRDHPSEFSKSWTS